MTLEEILALEDIPTKIQYLKKGRKTDLPDCERLYNDWNPHNHEVIRDEEKYPKKRITVKPAREYFDEKTNKVVKVPAEYKDVEPNRIALPIEQDIVNIHTAFTVGLEPLMECTPADNEQGLFDTLRFILRQNKIKYQNKKIVRSWLSEQECAEYWYSVKDDNFWSKVKNLLFGNVKPEYRLKSVLWSPFRGDKLYPFFDDAGNMIAFSREYKKKDIEGMEYKCFMTITDKYVYNWDFSTYVQETSFAHGFDKLPVIYSYRSHALCDNIKYLRIRLEKLLSNYADCIDYHFFPILKLFGDVVGLSGDFKGRMVQLTGDGADAQYLTWQQASDTVKLELDNIVSMIYSMTNTPRVMPEQLKSVGGAFSGVSFRYMFMGAHLAVSNHAEEIEQFMQRRINFLVHALGKINRNMSKASESIDVTVELQPYMIDSIDDKVNTAVKAVSGGIWSRREGIVFAGNEDRINEELEEIQAEMNLINEKNAK